MAEFCTLYHGIEVSQVLEGKNEIEFHGCATNMNRRETTTAATTIAAITKSIREESNFITQCLYRSKRQCLLVHFGG